MDAGISASYHSRRDFIGKDGSGVVGSCVGAPFVKKLPYEITDELKNEDGKKEIGKLKVNGKSEVITIEGLLEGEKLRLIQISLSLFETQVRYRNDF